MKNHQSRLNDEDVRSSWFTTMSSTNRGKLHQPLESGDGVPLPETKGTVVSSKFKPEADKVCFCNSPLGISYLSSMMRTMSLNAETNLPLSNHSVRATSVTILADANVENRPHQVHHWSQALSRTAQNRRSNRKRKCQPFSVALLAARISTHLVRISRSVKQIQWIFPCGKSFALPERPAAVNLNDHASKSTGIFPGVSSSFPISRLFDNHCEQQLLWITPEQFPRILLLQTFLKRFYAFKIGAPSLNFRLAE